MSSGFRPGRLLAALLSSTLWAPAFAQSIPGEVYGNDRAAQEQRPAIDLQNQVTQQTEDNRLTEDLRERFMNQTWLEDALQKQKDLVVLPPMPAPLLEERPDFPATAYPENLADYAGETFFMPHASLRIRRLLKTSQSDRVERYRAARQAQVAALRARLVETAPLPPEGRGPALALFAATQAPALRALEAEAEAIRADLAAIDTGAAVAKQREGEATLKTAGLRNYLSCLLAAQFYDGLATEQRQLLGEIALESVVTRPAGDRTAPVFFLPSPGRLRPPELPEAVAAKWEEFDRQRKALKDELVGTVVYDQEKLTPAKRTMKYASIATRQAPLFEQLNRRAEEIRVAMAGLPYPDQPAPTGLPPDLVRQVGMAVEHKNGFQLAYSRRFQDLSRQFPPARFKLTIEKNQPVIQMFSMSETNGKAKGPGNALLLKLAEHKALIERDYAALSTEMEAARAAVQRYRETLTGDEVPEVSQLLASLAQAHDREETWRRSADYRAAVLLPGLSPAQRRLLFGAALRDLEKHRLATTE